MHDIGREPFNGMAKRPWLMFWSLILVMLIWLTGCILLFTSCYTVQSETTTQHTVTSFTGFSINNGSLILQGEDQLYTITHYEYYGEAFLDPSTLCTGEIFSAYVSKTGYIYSLTDSDGYQYITFQSERAAYRDSQRFAMIGLPIMLVLSILHFALAIAVSRNPEWSPKWLQYMLFRFGAI